jgi:hypothetical protein
VNEPRADVPQRAGDDELHGRARLSFPCGNRWICRPMLWYRQRKSR